MKTKRRVNIKLMQSFVDVGNRDELGNRGFFLLDQIDSRAGGHSETCTHRNGTRFHHIKAHVGHPKSPVGDKTWIACGALFAANRFRAPLSLALLFSDAAISLSLSIAWKEIVVGGSLAPSFAHGRSHSTRNGRTTVAFILADLGKHLSSIHFNISRVCEDVIDVAILTLSLVKAV